MTTTVEELAERLIDRNYDELCDIVDEYNRLFGLDNGDVLTLEDAALELAHSNLAMSRAHINPTHTRQESA